MSRTRRMSGKPITKPSSASASEATHIHYSFELENRVIALEAEIQRLRSSSSSGSLSAEIAEFGEQDHARLNTMDSSDVKRITVVTDPHLVNVRKLLKNLIREEKIVLMDKESGISFTASGVVGFEGNRLLLFNER